MFEYIVYESGVYGDSRLLIIEKDLVLPEGFNIAEKCRVGVFVHHEHDPVCELVPVSHRYFEEAFISDQPDILDIAYSYAGGEEEVNRLVSEILDEYKHRGNPLDEVLSTGEAAELWGLSDTRVKHLCAGGDIKARKVGDRWLVLKNQPNPKQRDRK